MGGGQAYKPWETGSTPPPETETGAWEEDYVRAQAPGRAVFGGDVGTTYQQGQGSQDQGQKPWERQRRAVYGGDVGQTYRPGTQSQGTGQWKPPYGGDVDRTYKPGQPTTGRDPRAGRKPWEVDSPIAPGGSGNPTGGNPGEPRWDPTKGGTRQLPGWDTPAPGTTQPGGTGTGGTRVAESPIAQQRKLVDAALDYNTVGHGGNMVAGAGGAVFAKHTLPWLMDQMSKSVKLDPNREQLSFRQVFGKGEPLSKPLGFRERLVSYWQDNHNEATWNRGEIVTNKKDLSSFVEQSKTLFERNASKLEWAQHRSTALGPLMDPNVTDKVTAAKNAIAANGNTRMFSSQELKWLAEVEAGGAVPDGLKQSWQVTRSGLENRATRDTVFKILGDHKKSLDIRKTLVEGTLAEIEAAAAKGKPTAFSAADHSMLKGYQAAALEEAKLAEQNAGRLAAIKKYGGKYGGTIMRGAGIAATFMVADHYLDKAMGNNHDNGIGNTVNSILVPMALLTTEKMPLKYQLGVGLGGLVGGKLIGSMLDSALPAGEYPKYGRMFRQGTAESIALGAEFLLPMKSNPKALLNWKRAGLMGATWLAFRAKNALWDAPPPSELKDEAFGLMKRDARVRTEGSMNNAIDKFVALGKGDESAIGFVNWFKEGRGKAKGARGEAALHVYRTEWLGKKNDEYGSMLEAYRGATILCTAFAESRLRHGTHVPTITDTPTYLLEGKNLDVGGKAARDLAIARINVERAQTEARNKMGQEVNGEKVTEDEIKDLDDVKKRIEESEAKIYGKHDMWGAVQELAEWGKGGNSNHVTKLLLDVKSSIGINQNAQDKRYLAKLYRDSATYYLAAALRFKDGDPRAAKGQLYGDQYQGVGADGAQAALKRARELDPNNPDMQELDQIFNDLAKEIPGNIQQNDARPIMDPLGVRRNGG